MPVIGSRKEWRYFQDEVCFVFQGDVLCLIVSVALHELLVKLFAIFYDQNIESLNLVIAKFENETLQNVIDTIFKPSTKLNSN